MCNGFFSYNFANKQIDRIYREHKEYLQIIINQMSFAKNQHETDELINKIAQCIQLVLRREERLEQFNIFAVFFNSFIETIYLQRTKPNQLFTLIFTYIENGN